MQLYVVTHCYDFGSEHPEVAVELFQEAVQALKVFGETLGMPPLSEEDLAEGIPEFVHTDDGWTSDPEAKGIDELVTIETRAVKFTPNRAPLRKSTTRRT